MNKPDFAIPTREPDQIGLDDTILPFAVKALDLRGRIVRMPYMRAAPGLTAGR